MYAVTKREDVCRASDVFINNMASLVYMLIGVSVLIFCIVMYLMVKVMIDRSAQNISLIKIFGYNKKEVKKLYLNGELYVVAIGTAFCIPLAKFVMDSIYPLLVANVSCDLNLSVSWITYVGIYMSVIILYIIISKLLVRKLNGIMPAEVLKNRE